MRASIYSYGFNVCVYDNRKFSIKVLVSKGLFDYVMFVCWYLSIVKFIEVTNFLYLVITKAGKTEQTSITNTYAACPRMWIGFGNRCFYFSEDSGNWTFSKNYCMALKAQLAQIDSQEELVRNNQNWFVVCSVEYLQP